MPRGSGQVSSVGADGSYDENYNWSGYLQLEHGILLLPNASSMSPTSAAAAAASTTILLKRPEPLLSPCSTTIWLPEIDLGLTGRRYDGDFNTQHYSYDKGCADVPPAPKLRILGTALLPSVMPACRMPTTTTTVWAALQVLFRAAQDPRRLAWRPRWTSIVSIRPSTGWFIGGEFTF